MNLSIGFNVQLVFGLNQILFGANLKEIAW
jgi:hypothetical protein